MPLADLRKDYALGGLREADLDPDPFRQFSLWFDQATAAGLKEPSAMTLATATPDGLPSARIVLLKFLDESGFTFFTNYGGRKGRELSANPNAALLFFWPELERQVRVEGTVEPVSQAESERYFQSRPLASRLAAWASPQSEVIPNRAFLERRWEEMAKEYEGREVPLPPFWGGFRLRPVSIEFWQGRPNRLHDRLRYRRLSNGGWQIERLGP
jgi:pyridoxamine 5'-phosphate oxidase